MTGGVRGDARKRTSMRQVVDSLTSTHWLVFNGEREVTGCHCGFLADVENDCGWGDSVVEHLIRVGASAALS